MPVMVAGGAGGDRPRRATCAGAAAEVDDRFRRGCGCLQRANRLSHGDEMKRRVIERKCGSFTHRVECAMDVLAAPALAAARRTPTTAPAALG